MCNLRHSWVVKTWPVFRGRGITRAGPRGGPLRLLVPSEGKSPFTYVGAFIPNVCSLVDIFRFVQVFDYVKFL